ncbi:tryptophan synthase beta subunit-like PLP-dependent enzyme [Xylariaceae sp. FL0662B]|nr:tryptophan synthase beta subunit-like PLP-dependent enzyme [Xylariaceae sp. FL0662B]
MPSTSSSSIRLNPAAQHWTHPHPHPHAGADSEPGPDTAAAVLAFHQSLPAYAETALRPLPAVARALGLANVLLKDESARCGLPAFKILGASWAVWRAVRARLGPSAAALDFDGVGAEARRRGVRVVTLTEGNCGRAVARMAATYLGLRTTVYVPALVSESTRALIRGEGAEVVEVVEVQGTYDEVVRVVVGEARGREDVVAVLDVGVEGYEEVPAYFVEGYTTMLAESERQVHEATGGKPATHAIVPVGAGSIGEAVTAYFKDAARVERSGAAKVLAVEPTTAACLHESMKAGESVTVPTEDTIMCGMNCGTLSTTAWPVLKAGVDASVVVTDLEAHAAVEELKLHGVLAGPCGAATLAALRRVSADTKEELGLGSDSVVVLYCTEGARDYPTPSPST